MFYKPFPDHTDTLLNKFPTISTSLKENLDIYDEILDQKICHILEKDERNADRSLLNIPQNVKGIFK